MRSIDAIENGFCTEVGGGARERSSSLELALLPVDRVSRALSPNDVSVIFAASSRLDLCADCLLCSFSASSRNEQPVFAEFREDDGKATGSSSSRRIPAHSEQTRQSSSTRHLPGEFSFRESDGFFATCREASAMTERVMKHELNICDCCAELQTLLVQVSARCSHCYRSRERVLSYFDCSLSHLSCLPPLMDDDPHLSSFAHADAFIEKAATLIALDLSATPTKQEETAEAACVASLCATVSQLLNDSSKELLADHQWWMCSSTSIKSSRTCWIHPLTPS